jgi:hypothetical protein
MDYETIIKVESFIENLSNPRKQRIVRELIVHPNFEIFQQEILGKNELLIKDKSTTGVFRLSGYVHTRCNCGQ